MGTRFYTHAHHTYIICMHAHTAMYYAYVYSHVHVCTHEHMHAHGAYVYAHTGTTMHTCFICTLKTEADL